MKDKRIAILLLGLFVVGGFHVYEQERIANLPDYTAFPLPAEDAPLTQRELDILQGLIPDEPLLPPEVVIEDGTYTSNAMYLVPRTGGRTLQTTTTLADGRIKSISVRFVPDGDFDEARIFIANYRKQVVDKKIQALEFQTIEGAELTSNAFRNALRDITGQAEERS